MTPVSPHGTTPPWVRGGLPLDRPRLAGSPTADVCVVGAGIAGLCCAYALARAGRRVVVLDRGPIGGGETGRTTAHLANAFDDRYFRVERAHGAEAAATIARSHSAAIDFLERVAFDEGIECGFERLDGYLFLPPGESADVLERERDAASRAGLTDVEIVPRAPMFDSGPSLRFPRQAQFEPMRFLAGLARAVERLGGVIHCGEEVRGLSAGSTLTVRCASGAAVHASDVILATNTPDIDRFVIHTKQSAHRTYAVAARVPRGAIPRALCWDTAQEKGETRPPYHYVRLADDPHNPAAELLIIGGEDHRTGDHDDAGERWGALEAWGRARFPDMRDVAFRWSGQVMEPHDGVAFIGPNPSGPRGAYIVTGDSGMGMTHAAVAAILLPELIAGREHPWASLYDPGRKPVSSLGEFTAEAARVAGRYADHLTLGNNANSLKPGEGRVVRRGLHLVAIARDSAGAIHERNAVCPHLGCVVRWNSAEQSWDCPCHGSRFDPAGRVLNGPSNAGLPAADQSARKSAG